MHIPYQLLDSWRGKCLLCVCCIVLLTLHMVVLAADESRQLGWRDLMPARPELDDPFSDMPRAQLVKLGVIARIRKQQAAGQELSAASLNHMKRLAGKLATQGVDVDDLLARGEEIAAKRRAAAKAVVPALDGQQVRIPGYVVPLDFDGKKVTEFLLVPFVGACIHVPPPPPNQIVHVRFAPGYATAGMFSPVWVEGRMSVGHAEHKLSLADGASNVDVGYSLLANNVEIYRQ